MPVIQSDNCPINVRIDGNDSSPGAYPIRIPSAPISACGIRRSPALEQAFSCGAV